MGKTIVSWSTVHGQSGTTANTVALSSMFALDHPYRSLLTHTQLTFSTLEFLYAQGKRALDFDDVGMEALERLVISKLIKPDAISDYTDTIYKNRLDLLFGKKERNEDEAKKDHIIRTILDAAKEFYDVLWVDAHSGNFRKTTKSLIEEADLVLVNLPQNRYVIDRFFSGEDFPAELKNKDYIVLISMYDENISYSLRNIKRSHKVKVPIFGVPYCKNFKDATNLQSVSEFFYRSLQVKKGDDSFAFIRNLREINNFILKKFEFTEYEEEVI